MTGDEEGKSDFLSDGVLRAAPENLSPATRRLIEIFREQVH